MAHILRLTDGAGTVNLTDWADYVPKSPDLEPIDYTPAGMYDGGERPIVTRNNVTETCGVWVDDTTTDAIRATVRSVELLFGKAQHYQRTRMGSAVYVEIDPDTSGTVYRSEVLSGNLQLHPDALKVGQWTGKRIGADITWTRRYYWEGPETALTLSNSHGTSTAGTVYFHADSAHDNYLAIAGTAVGGVLPTPVKLTLNNTSGTTIRAIYIGHNAWSNPSSLTCTLECEDSAGAGGTAIGSALYSGTVGYVDNVGTAYTAMYWLLSAGTLNAFAGNWIVPLLRTHNPNLAGCVDDIACYTRLQLSDDGIYTAHQTGEVSINADETSHIVGQLEAFRLPAWLPGTIGYMPARLYLYYKATDVAVPGSIVFDSLTLMPADSYRMLSPAVYLMGTTEIIVDDMITKRTYISDNTGTANISCQFVPIGGPIELWPDRDQRLYFNASGCPGTALLRVSAAYRPRRLTL